MKRSFSINKQTSSDNLKDKSLMARRLIIDAVNQVGEVIRFPLTKKLLSYASSARKKYYHYREKEKGSWKRRRKCEKEKADEEEQHTWLKIYATWKQPRTTKFWKRKKQESIHFRINGTFRYNEQISRNRFTKRIYVSKRNNGLTEHSAIYIEHKNTKI